jgi:hypothetical protein
VVNVVEKLELSLLSGLPNETDFAINVTLLLSSEGKRTLHVTHCPFLVELLLAHVGIFREGMPSLVFCFLVSNLVVDFRKHSPASAHGRLDANVTKKFL